MSLPEYYRLTIKTSDGQKRHMSSREVNVRVLVENRQNSNIKGIALTLTGHPLPYWRMDEMLNRLLDNREFIPVSFMELEYIRICRKIPEYGDPWYDQYIAERNRPDVFQYLDNDLMQEDEPVQREIDPLAVLDPNQEIDASWLQERTTLEYICQLCELLRVSVRKIYFPMPAGLTADIFYFPGDSLARGEKWHGFFNWLAEEKQRVDRAIGFASTQQPGQSRKKLDLEIKERQKELKSFMWNPPAGDGKVSCVIL